MRFLCTVLFLAVVLSVSSTRMPAANKASDYRMRHRAVSSKIKYVQKKLAVVRKKQRVAAGQLYSTQRKLIDTREDLIYTRNRLTAARGKLSRINARLRAAEERLQSKRIAFTERLAEAYKRPPQAYMVALVTSEDTWQAMTSAKMLQQVVEGDKRLLADIRQTRAEIKRHQSIQRNKVIEIRGLESGLKSKETQERQLAWQQQAHLEEIIGDRVQYERMLDELVEESSRIASIIKRLQQSTAAGRKRLETPFRGGFIRPVSGRISSGFGMRFHPILHKRKLHTGVDISCPIGTPVRAAASGTVVVSEWNRAYGFMVVIDHGGGVATLYGHNTRNLVRVGQEVSQGDVIARSGSTGWSTGPHLHFEVQRNGRPVNPL